MPSKNVLAATMPRSAAAEAGVLTADDAVRVVTANSKKLFGFTRKILPRGIPSEPKWFIYSVSDYGEMVDLGTGLPKFQVNACPEGEEYGEACSVAPIVFFEEAKVDVTEFTPVTDVELVDAILRIGPGMDTKNDRRKMGWFASEHNPPKPQEVARAVGIYTQRCKELVDRGNQLAEARQFNEINEEHRRAAKYLKIKVSWNSSQHKMVDCPGCGEAVREGIVWHATPHGCGYIFDVEEYDARFAAGRAKKEA
jgi:hypothetical protein